MGLERLKPQLLRCRVQLLLAEHSVFTARFAAIVQTKKDLENGRQEPEYMSLASSLKTNALRQKKGFILLALKSLFERLRPTNIAARKNP